MKVAVVGAGAMGSLFGGRLAEGGSEVWLIDIWMEHIAAMRERGLAFTEGHATRHISVHATTNAKDAGTVDLVIIFVKHHETRQAIRDALPLVTGKTLVLSVQNGIGNIDIIREVVLPAQIVMGLTTLTSIVRGPGHIESNFVGPGETYIWPVTGQVTDAVQGVAEGMRRAGLFTQVSSDVEFRLWKKLIINATLTAVSAFLRLRVHPLASHPNGHDLLVAAAREVIAVAQAKGIPLSTDEGLGYLEKLSEQAKEHIGSMTIDVIKGRKTEIETMNGAVVCEGERLGVPTPVNRTIFNIMRVLEDTHGERL